MERNYLSWCEICTRNLIRIDAVNHQDVIAITESKIDIGLRKLCPQQLKAWHCILAYLKGLESLARKLEDLQRQGIQTCP